MNHGFRLTDPVHRNAGVDPHGPAVLEGAACTSHRVLRDRVARAADVTPTVLVIGDEHAAASLAGYKTPRSVEFVDALPLSAANKVLKRVLRARHAEQTGQGEESAAVR